MIMNQIEINSQFSHAFKCFFKHQSVKRQIMNREGISQKVSSLDSAYFHNDINQLKLRLQPNYYWISTLKSQNEKNQVPDSFTFLKGVIQSSWLVEDYIHTHAHKKIIMELRATFFFNKMLVNIFQYKVSPKFRDSDNGSFPSRQWLRHFWVIGLFISLLKALGLLPRQIHTDTGWCKNSLGSQAI